MVRPRRGRCAIRNINRRTALAGIAAATVASTVAAASTEPDPIFAAMEKHLAAMTNHTRLVTIRGDLGDGPESGKLGPQVSVADEAAYQAVIKLTETVPTTQAGILALLDYIDRVNMGRPDGELSGATDDMERPRIGRPDVEYRKGTKNNLYLQVPDDCANCAGHCRRRSSRRTVLPGNTRHGVPRHASV
jgi:hypothetical protein